MRVTGLKNKLRTPWTLFTRRFFRLTPKVIYEADLSSLPDLLPQLNAKYRFGQYPDIERLDASLYDYDREAKCYAQSRLEQEDRVVIGECENTVVFYGWVTLGRMELGLDRFADISKTAVFVYKLYTHPAFRGRGILAGFYAYIKPMFIRMGFERTYCTIHPRNSASIAAHEKCGFRPVGTMYEIQLFSHLLYYLPRKISHQLL
jgi:RimJ/RimL family protein N-acetyltransferase